MIPPARQLDLIILDDFALERLHRDVRFVSEQVPTILDSLPVVWRAAH